MKELDKTYVQWLLNNTDSAYNVFEGNLRNGRTTAMILHKKLASEDKEQ